VADRLTIGLSLSLSGAYAAMGRQAEAGLRLFVADANAAGGLRLGGKHYEFALECHDDLSDPARCAEIYRSLCLEHRADLIFGPYSSGLTRVAAPIAEQAGLVMVNHGGAIDDLYTHHYRGLIGVLSSAGDYLLGYARLLSTLKFWRKRVAILTAPTPFARAVANGLEQACLERTARRHGVRIRLKYAGDFQPDRTPATLVPALIRNRINVLASAASYGQDIELMRLVTSSALNIPVLACVAAGVSSFRADLGENAEGIVGPSQWEEQFEIAPELGPTPAEFAWRMRAAHPGLQCDYPAAQPYAAGLLTGAALASAGALDQGRIRAAFSDLRTSTFYGKFAIDPATGRQIGHQVLLVQWHGGHKVIIEPEAQVESGTLELPSGWRLILASFQALRISREKRHSGREGPDGDDGRD
jgi:branched-chain amino acid transport system substrate-binding protein